MIGPPRAVLYCWFFTGSTMFSTGFFAFNLLSRKLPRKRPDTRLLPDFVIAFT